MRRLISRIGVILSAGLGSAIGLITLLGLLFGNVRVSLGALAGLPVIGEQIPSDVATLPTGFFAGFFLQVAVVTTALLVVMGILNLLAYNVSRILRGATLSAKLNSVAVFASFTITILLYVLDRNRSMILLEDGLVTIESALAGLLFFVLVYGGFRILKDRTTAARLLFVISVLIVLVAALPLDNIAPLRDITDWILAVPVNAGARGILLGIALATVVTGLRVLIGQDRSYGE